MKTLIVRIAMILGALVALAGASAAVLVAVASHRIGRRWDVPAPAVVADRSSAAVPAAPPSSGPSASAATPAPTAGPAAGTWTTCRPSSGSSAPPT